MQIETIKLEEEKKDAIHLSDSSPTMRRLSTPGNRTHHRVFSGVNRIKYVVNRHQKKHTMTLEPVYSPVPNSLRYFFSNRKKLAWHSNFQVVHKRRLYFIRSLTFEKFEYGNRIIL